MKKAARRLDCIIFDLDNTLYPRDSGVMAEIGRRIQVWLCERLGVERQQAAELRRQYLHRYGTTMGGLIAERDIDVSEYLDFVHDIRIEDYLEPNRDLAEMLARIPLRKVVYSNATSEHGRRVLRSLGITDQFERVIGIEDVDLCNKLNRGAYERMLGLLAAKGPECMMVEDSPRNLRPAKALGMTTILLAPKEGGRLVEVGDECVDFAVDDVLDVGPLVDQLLACTGTHSPKGRHLGRKR
ncbi:MAG: pyrimidine 5'-nucleotidase [Anaerolineae bacterium]|jgi:putative hydrolase of the HAD superfamily